MDNEFALSEREEKKQLNENSKFIDLALFFMSRKRKNIQITSFSTYVNYLKKHISPFWGNVEIKEIDEFMFDEFYEILEKNEKVSSNTKNEIITLFCQMADYAFNQGWIKKKIEAYKFKTEGVKKKEIYTEDEIYALKQEERKLNRIIIFILFNTGLRIAELSGLKWEDVDFEKREIEIKRQITRVYGANYKDGKAQTEIIEKGLKSKASYRKIPMTSEIYYELKKWKEEQKEVIKNCKFNEPNYDYVVLGLEPRLIRYYFTSSCKKTQVENKTVHAVRHTLATKMVSNSKDYKAIAEILGHTPNVLMNTYVQTNEVDKARIMNEVL